MDLGTNLALVTGAAGWLGSRLIGALLGGLTDHPTLGSGQKNLRVRALVLPDQVAAHGSAPSTVETTVGDVTNEEDCRRFCGEARHAVLFHTAGIIHPRRVSDFYRVNVEGTRNVLAAAAEAGVRRVVVMSSNSPCGCNPFPDHLFDESSPYRPYMHYGRSKMWMEQVTRDFHATGKVETVLIRAPWFYGPNQPPRQTLFFRMIGRGRAPLVGRGDNLRSMAYIDNLCQGMMLAGLTPRAAGRTYWIADRRPYAMKEIIDTVERLLEQEFGRKCAHKRMRLPNLASEMAFLADKLLQSAGLYQQKIHVLSEMNKTIACSVSRAEEELDYRPTVELEEGMRRSLAWCQEQGLEF